MCRHCRARGEMFKRIKDGAIGDLTMMRAYRMAGPHRQRIYHAQARQTSPAS